MDSFVRGRRLLLIGAALVVPAFVACGAAHKDDHAVGVSDRPPGASKPKEISDAGPRDGAAALPAGYRSSFTKVNKGRLVSTGHASGRWEVDVFANDEAQKALAARAKAVPPGAIVVEEHYERTADGQRGAAGPVMVMEKRARGTAPEHGDWRWAVIGASGALVRDGVVEQCAGCHDDAPMDGLFPIVE